MQGIYDYIPETNHVCRVYSVAAVLYVQVVLHVMLFRTRNSMFCTFTLLLLLLLLSLGECPRYLPDTRLGELHSWYGHFEEEKLCYTTGAN
jgi:hypothetical protein